jgi:hypothetical protein
VATRLRWACHAMEGVLACWVVEACGLAGWKGRMLDRMDARVHCSDSKDAGARWECRAMVLCAMMSDAHQTGTTEKSSSHSARMQNMRSVTRILTVLCISQHVVRMSCDGCTWRRNLVRQRRVKGEGSAAREVCHIWCTNSKLTLYHLSHSHSSSSRLVTSYSSQRSPYLCNH